MKTLLQELEYISSITDDKHNDNIGWADGAHLLGKHVELLEPKNRKLLNIGGGIEASGKVGSTEWILFNPYNIVREIGSQPSYRALVQGKYDEGDAAEALKMFGRNVKLLKQAYNLALETFDAGDLGLISVHDGVVQSVVSLLRRGASYAVETAVSKNSPTVKLHEIYADFIKQEDAIMTTSSQSEGGANLWMRLSAVPGIAVHGWDKKKQVPINLGPRFDDDSETHVDNKELYDPDDYSKSNPDYDFDDPEDSAEISHLHDIQKNIILVAAKKK